MTMLVRPSADRFDDWVDLLTELLPETDDGYPNGAGGAWEPTREGFTHYLTHVARIADTSVPPPEGRVHDDLLWIADDAGALVGFLSLRHELTDWLLNFGGHIGYSVRPSRRREGHATAALAEAVERAAALGIDRVLVTCDDDNVASAATIERCGGVLEDVRDDKRRYWITTPPGPAPAAS